MKILKIINSAKHTSISEGYRQAQKTMCNNYSQVYKSAEPTRLTPVKRNIFQRIAHNIKCFIWANKKLK